MNLDTSTDPLPEDLITPKAAAKACHVSLQSMWRWIRIGRVRAWRAGQCRLLVSQKEVLAQIRPVVPTVRIPPRDKNMERLLGDLDRKAAAEGRRMMGLPPRETETKNGNGRKAK